jgi:hypothetical protein
VRTSHAVTGRPAGEALAEFADPLAREFLEERGFRTVWPKFQKQFATEAARRRAFGEWFDALATLKFIHFLTEKRWPRLPHAG